MAVIEWKEVTVDSVDKVVAILAGTQGLFYLLDAKDFCLECLNNPREYLERKEITPMFELVWLDSENNGRGGLSAFFLDGRIPTKEERSIYRSIKSLVDKIDTPEKMESFLTEEQQLLKVTDLLLKSNKNATLEQAKEIAPLALESIQENYTYKYKKTLKTWAQTKLQAAVVASQQALKSAATEALTNITLVKKGDTYTLNANTLDTFVEQHHLDYAKLIDLTQGTVKSHKGFKLAAQ